MKRENNMDAYENITIRQKEETSVEDEEIERKKKEEIIIFLYLLFLDKTISFSCLTY